MNHSSFTNLRFFVLSVFVVSVIGSFVSNYAWSREGAKVENVKSQLTAAQATDSPIDLDTATGKIFGNLLMPPTEKAASAPVTLVIIHSGSGPTDRDGNLTFLPGKNESLKMLAKGLAQSGIASLRYDKRGVAQSTPAMLAEKDLRFDIYVDDLAAWIAKMKSDKRFSRIVIAGHSEGSLIGMIAADKTKVDGYISIAGMARSIGEVLRTQLKPQLPEALWNESERVLKSLEAGKTVDDPPATLAAMYRPSVQPFLISFLSKRPIVEIAKLDMPILILQGTTDLQIAVSEAEALRAAAPKASLAVLGGMNHVLKNVTSESPQNTPSYGDPTLPLHAELVPRIVKFVEAIK
jgi:uncharacterized protein